MSVGRHLLELALVGLVGGVMALAWPVPAGAQAMPSSYPSTADRTALGGGPAALPYENALPGIAAAVPDGQPGGTAGLPGSGYSIAGRASSGTPAPPGAPQSPSGDPGPLYAPYGSPDADHRSAAVPAAARPLEQSSNVERWLVNDEPWTWQVLPTGLMYKSYLAGGQEPRFGTQFVHQRTQGWLWDSTLGARVGVVRYGTDNDFRPEGWQLDAEGAALLRMNLPDRDVFTTDFRAGMPLTRRVGPWETKFGYYHLSSHLGDEFMLTHPGFARLNYVRDVLVFGVAAYLSPDLRLYSEAGWAFHVDGGSQPWEFQFGADWSPAEPTGGRGTPFFAINGHLRQENDFGGNMTVQAGWQWRGATGHLFRIGMQYFNGMSERGEFFDAFEEQIGAGLWYDF